MQKWKYLEIIKENHKNHHKIEEEKIVNNDKKHEMSKRGTFLIVGKIERKKIEK